MWWTHVLLQVQNEKTKSTVHTNGCRICLTIRCTEFDEVALFSFSVPPVRFTSRWWFWFWKHNASSEYAIYLMTFSWTKVIIHLMNIQAPAHRACSSHLSIFNSRLHDLPLLTNSCHRQCSVVCLPSSDWEGCYLPQRVSPAVPSNVSTDTGHPAYDTSVQQ